jgi:deoxyhypusine synthase
MTWGKVDPDKLPDSVTCYVDSTIALPLVTAYALSRCEKRPPKRLFDKFPELTHRLEAGYAQTRAKRPE